MSDTSSLLPSSDPITSAVNYRGSLGTSISSVTSGYGSTLLSTGVSSSTGGVMIEPVSPDEGYHVDDDRPLLHNATQGLYIHNTIVLYDCHSGALDINFFNLRRNGQRSVKQRFSYTNNI